MSAIIYINRESGKKENENAPAAKTLLWMYNHPIAKLSLEALFKRKFFSSLGGWYMNTRLSAGRIKNFILDQKIDMDDYIEPKGGYTSFNDFFYRKLKDKARPVADHLVSPADGKILAFENIKDNRSFFIKGNEFTLKDFLKEESLIEKFKDGSMIIIRLAPVDYHRFHFPADGYISKSSIIKGHYYSVSPFALQKSLEIFCANQREYSILKNENYGDILISEVGATMVGSIIQTYKADTEVKKGQEKGYFAFGGSTLVVLTEKGKIKIDDDLIENTKKGFETKVKMGEKIAE